MINNKQEKSDNDFNTKLIEMKLKSTRNVNIVIFFTILTFLLGTASYMLMFKQYPEQIIEIEVEKIVEKQVEKQIYIKETRFFISEDMFIKYSIWWNINWDKKFSEIKKLLSTANENQLNTKIFITEVYTVNSINWKKLNTYKISKAFLIKDFIKGELSFIEKTQTDPIPEEIKDTNKKEVK